LTKQGRRKRAPGVRKWIGRPSHSSSSSLPPSRPFPPSTQNGFDIIYEARDLDLPQSTRDGLDQVRSSLAATKARIAEAERRVDGKLGGYVQKAYWTLAREELRGQLGTLRFDLNTVASSLSKDGKTAATEAKNEFLAAADKLDFAIRQKNSDKANAALATTQAALDAAIATLG